MTAYFKVTNYDQQQHYKDRGPTWIKLYNRLLDDYGFAQLPDAAKWHLIGIQLQASRHDNRIPADPAWLARQIGASDAIDLGVLEKGGFIVPLPDVVSGSEISGNPASTEKRREEREQRREDILSAGADPARAYSKDFEEFWKNYPTDKLMSKKMAHGIWRRMSGLEQVLARDSLPSFRAYVAQQKNYRVVHAWKYLSERRYEGFPAQGVDDGAKAASLDKADRLLKRGKYAETKQ